MQRYRGKNSGYKRRITTWLLCLISAFIAPSGLYASTSLPRFALLVGNGSYNKAPLKNPKNDVTLLSNSLSQLGFNVSEYTDLNRREMRAAIRKFGNLLEETRGIGLFYFAGHGVQINGENYLIPLDTDIQDTMEIIEESISVNGILKRMEQARNGANLIILDACRNSPFPKRFRSITRGLERIDGPIGSLLAYATAPGAVAMDGNGKHGLYTKTLVKYLGMPGLTLNQVFIRVRREVRELSNGKQIPWESSSLVRDIYLHAGPPGLQTTESTISNNVTNNPANTWDTDIQRESYQKGDFYYKQGKANLAMPRYMLAAVEGNPLAQAAIAKLYYLGKGSLKQNIEEANRWARMALPALQAASRGGYKQAQYHLAYLYSKGIVVKEDMQESIRLYTLSAENGYVFAQNNLGYMYSTGKAGIVDEKKSIYWYLKAAEQGHRTAQFNLGIRYEKGDGVDQSIEVAKYWFQQAADQGHPGAKVKLDWY